MGIKVKIISTPYVVICMENCSVSGLNGDELTTISIYKYELWLAAKCDMIHSEEDRDQLVVFVKEDNIFFLRDIKWGDKLLNNFKICDPAKTKFWTEEFYYAFNKTQYTLII